MRKRCHAAIILASACLLCGCTDGQAQENPAGEGSIPMESPQDTEMGAGMEGVISGTEESQGTVAGTEGSQGTAAGAGSNEGTPQTAADSGAEDEIWFLGEDANAGFGFTAEEYDYVFNFRGFYITLDGEAEQIFIDPIEFVWPAETERWLAWGFSLDEPGSYSSRNEEEELISLPLAKDTEFHMWDNHTPMLEELCERSSDWGEYVTTRPEVFLYYVKSQDYPLTDWPFFMILDEEGNVKYVVEHPLVG